MKACLDSYHCDDNNEVDDDDNINKNNKQKSFLQHQTMKFVQNIKSI